MSEHFSENPVGVEPLPVSTTENALPAEAKGFEFKELTLWDAFMLFLFRPNRVMRQLFAVILDLDHKPPPPANDAAAEPQPNDLSAMLSGDNTPTPIVISPQGERSTALKTAIVPAEDWRTRLSLGKNLIPDRERLGHAVLILVAILITLVGSALLREAALDPEARAANDLNGSIFWLGFGVFMLLLGALIQSKNWWQAQIQHLLTAKKLRDDSAGAVSLTENTINSDSLPATRKISFETRLQNFFAWFERHSMRFGLLPLAVLLAWFAYDANVELDAEGEVEAVVFTTFGFFSWVAAIVLWYLILGVDLNRLATTLVGRFRRQLDPQSFAIGERGEIIRAPKTQADPRPRRLSLLPSVRWTYFALIPIALLALYFRTHHLDGVPPEMTSDHIEKLRNAIEVEEGIYGVFFANNGGREPFQMYFVAFIADWLGNGFDFRALKYATIAEGFVTVLLLYWLGKELIGCETAEQRRLGDWVGLAAAALLAISSWHTMLSRLGLRIALTPLTTLLVAIFLIRAVRYNRRIDYINIGLVLGAGMYFYQSNRMLPILVVAMIFLAALVTFVRDVVQRRPPDMSVRYGINLLFCGLLAGIIYLPMYRYSQEYPDDFWSRTYGRIFGADTGIECEPNVIVPAFVRPATSLEAFEWFNERRYYNEGCEKKTGPEMLWRNYKEALVMTMWKGDIQEISNGSSYPALDAVSNALLILGLGAWVVLVVRRRDLALMIVPLGILIMLLPSTLSVFFYKENPSFTRASGTIPFIFLLAGLPLGLLAREIIKAGREHLLYYGVSALVIVGFVYSAAGSNYETYFDVYRKGYESFWRPYSQIAAPLRDFAESEGSYGNAFYVHTAHWLDHRILGINAGDIDWPNGLVYRTDVYAQIFKNQGTPYQYDPSKPLFFMINRADSDSIAWFNTYFPGGTLREVQIERDPAENYYIYEAPPGLEWLARRMTAETTALSCILFCLPGPE